jgi:alpha-beta hydrolase superfamily lysophospholipase
MPDFESSIVDAGETAIHLERGGSGPAVLLLHGFPETLAMWGEIASVLAERFSVVCADLRGYGASGCPASAADHAPYSKRALARDMVAVMTQLGFERFSIAGHDRGGRVATARRSTLRSGSSASRPSMWSPSTPRGIAPTTGSPSASGLGRCLRSPSPCPNDSSARRQRR